MKPSALWTTIALSLGTAAFSAHAANAYPASIQSAIDSGLKFEQSFDATAGLKGWILSKGPDNFVVVYTPPGGEVAIVGNMFDAKGNNLNQQYIDKFAPKPDFDKAWGQLESSAWVAEGPQTVDAKSIIYVFEDANCGFCHRTWQELQPYIKAGLQIRWLPVAFLAPDSMTQATELLAAKDANAALANLHANFGKKMAVFPPVDEVLKAKVDANAQLMEQLGFGGTPTIFYRDKDGKVRAKPGSPKPDELPLITGLAQPVTTEQAATQTN